MRKLAMNFRAILFAVDRAGPHHIFGPAHSERRLVDGPETRSSEGLWEVEGWLQLLLFSDRPAVTIEGVELREARLSFLITLSAIAESQRDRQVATGFEGLYFLEQVFAVFRIVRGRCTVQSP
jgi:hypothetical protein